MLDITSKRTEKASFHTVRFSIKRSTACRTNNSDLLSNVEVASSRINIEEF
jgi:hypothetical protein